MSVSLSEINAFTPQADLAKGDMYAPINLDNALRYGAQAAQSYSDNILKRYAMHQKMISDFVQNHQLDYAGVMQKDVQSLKQKSIAYFNKFAQNPKAINEIGNDADWQQLQGDFAQSKADNSLLDLQNQFRRTNPELYNQTNDAKQSAYINKPLGTRDAQDIQWDLPTALDFPALVKTVRENTGEKWSDVATDKDLPGYFIKREGKQYPRQEFDDLVTNIYQSDSMVGKDKFGHTISQAAQSHFELLPEQLKRPFVNAAKQTGSGDPAFEWYKKMMGDSYKDLIIEKETPVEDKYLAQTRDLAMKQKELDEKWWEATHIKKPESQAKIKMWKSNTAGSDEQLNAATTFATRIMGQMKALGTELADGSTIITSDKIPQLTGEHLKYMGFYTPGSKDFRGNVTYPGLQPLQLSDTDALMIRPDGTIQVLQKQNTKTDPNAAPYKLSKEKSTNVYNVMTNRVNEELKTAGSKELNAYLAPDLYGGNDESGVVSVSKTGGGTSETSYEKSTQSAKTPQQLSTMTPVKKGKKTYYVDAQTRIVYDENGNEVK